MTEVDFYVLASGDKNAQKHFACRLAEKAVRQGNNVMLLTEDETASDEMDTLLWVFAPQSFVPHSVLGKGDSEQVPVVISHDQDDHDHHDVLVNIQPGLPPHFSRFKRLAEIVIQEETVLQATRDNYAFYKQRGYPIKTHKIKG